LNKRRPDDRTVGRGGGREILRRSARQRIGPRTDPACAELRIRRRNRGAEETAIELMSSLEVFHKATAATLRGLAIARARADGHHLHLHGDVR
jgi:hypothetical protein